MYSVLIIENQRGCCMPLLIQNWSLENKKGINIKDFISSFHMMIMTFILESEFILNLSVV